MSLTAHQSAARAACAREFRPGCDIQQAWERVQKALPRCDPDVLSGYAALYASTIPKRRAEFPTDSAVSEKRILAYLAACPASVSGSGGHDAAFSAAVGLVRGFALPEDAALTWLLEHYNPRCEPPWREMDLRHKVKSAAKDGRRPLGYLK